MKSFVQVYLGIGAGTGLASLLKVEYPSAYLVSAVLCNGSEVVEGHSMKGKWETSWASSAKNDLVGDSWHP